MKKIYLFLGAAAMMASCSNEELVPNASSQNGIAAKGIVFEVTQEAPQTRGEFTKDEQSKHHFFWYAEQDRINLYANNVIANAINEDELGVAGDVTDSYGQGGFGEMPTGPAVYKATQSATTGLFTAVSDSNWIEFAGDNKVCAIATYPAATTTVTAVNANQDWGNVDGSWSPLATTNKVNWVTLSTTIPDEQTSAYNTAVSPMLSVTYGTREASYQSVTEKMPLQFKRLFPMVCISGVANNDSFNADFGDLNTVKITSEGGELEEGGNTYTLDAGTLAAATVTCKAVMGEDQKISEIENLTPTTPSSTIEVTTPGTWESKDRIYVSILPVDRTVTVAGTSKQVTDKVTLTFDYDNVTIHQDISTSNDWNVPNAVYSTKALDIAELYPYILTKGTSGTDRKLIINKGRLSDAIEKQGSTYYVIWDDDESTSTTVDFGGSIGEKKAVDVSNIIELEIREGAEALNNKDWEELNTLTALTTLTIKNSTASLKKINKLTSLTSIVANNITKIEYNAMSDLSSLASVEMNGVTNILFDNVDYNMPINSTALATVKMNSFDFAANKTLTKSILNPATLEELEMKGVESMKEVYPKDGMSLSGYEVLNSVKVQNGVVLGPEAFKGCVALTSVDGTVTLGGYGAFQNCEVLESVRLSEDAKIYDYTFDGAESLTKVYKGATGETEIKPVEVGAYAFQNTATNIDLTKTETIKAYAFKGVATLSGVYNSAKGISELTVNAHTIGNHAFMNTGIEYIQFTNLTLVNRALLAGTTPVELKFVNKVDFAEDFQSNGLGATGNTKLFVNSEQEYEGNKLVVKNEAIDFTITFKTIVEN